MLDKDLVGASTTLLVLGVIARGRTYGYDIVRQINASADGLFEWQEGTIYPVLHKLERDGLLKATWDAAADKGRKRKYYHLTPAGRAALKKRAERFSAFGTLVATIAGAKHA